jgi:hypothetical protein
MNRPQSQYDKLSARQAYAGSFEYALIEAWFKADGGNRTILEEAFRNTRFNLLPKES